MDVVSAQRLDEALGIAEAAVRGVCSLPRGLGGARERAAVFARGKVPAQPTALPEDDVVDARDRQADVARQPVLADPPVLAVQPLARGVMS